MTLPQVDLRVILPELIVTGTAILVMMWSVFQTGRQWVLRWVSTLGLLGALWQVLVLGSTAEPAFSGMYARDALTLVLQVAALLAALLALWLSGEYVERTRLEAGEYHALLLTVVLGAMLMAASTDLIMLFLGLETLSIPLYVMAAFARTDLRSQEAGMKYFLLGAFSTAFFLYGIALTFGAVGSTRLAALAAGIAAPSPVLLAGIGLLTIGLGFIAATRASAPQPICIAR